MSVNSIEKYGGYLAGFLQKRSYPLICVVMYITAKCFTHLVLSTFDFSFQLQLNSHCYGMWKEKVANSGGTHM